jgi:hypothetical protein
MHASVKSKVSLQRLRSSGGTPLAIVYPQRRSLGSAAGQLRVAVSRRRVSSRGTLVRQ